MNNTSNRTARRPQGLARNAVSLLVALGALGTLGACSTVPDRNVALDQAQARYTAAQAQTQVATLAPVELKRASEALRVAEQAKANGDSPATVDHLAYLASQRVGIAQDTAASRAAEAVTAGAAAERDRIRLALRTQEVDTAQRQLASSQQANVNTNQQLASAQQANANANQQLANSQQANASANQQLANSQQSNAIQQAQLASRDAQVGDLQSRLRELNARKTERGIVVTLGDVLFATGQASLQGDSVRTMGKLAEFFKRYPQRTAVIEGYTDSVGSESTNQVLSERRAQAVKSALVGQGVPSDRLRSEGFGEARPVGSNDSADGRRSNRRVEVVFPTEAGDAMLK
jgi:outer membrane protein OmpA-like peptidoglycan-associated protein